MAGATGLPQVLSGQWPRPVGDNWSTPVPWRPQVQAGRGQQVYPRAGHTAEGWRGKAHSLPRRAEETWYTQHPPAQAGGPGPGRLGQLRAFLLEPQAWCMAPAASPLLPSHHVASHHRPWDTRSTPATRDDGKRAPPPSPCATVCGARRPAAATAYAAKAPPCVSGLGPTWRGVKAAGASHLPRACHWRHGALHSVPGPRTLRIGPWTHVEESAKAPCCHWPTERPKRRRRRKKADRARMPEWQAGCLCSRE